MDDIAEGLAQGGTVSYLRAKIVNSNWTLTEIELSKRDARSLAYELAQVTRDGSPSAGEFFAMIEGGTAKFMDIPVRIKDEPQGQR